jgi:hypothetical protein
MADLDLPRLFNRLTTLFKVRPEQYTPALGKSIQPVFDVRLEMTTFKVLQQNLDLSGAVGSLRCFSGAGIDPISPGKRWKIMAWSHAAAVAAVGPGISDQGANCRIGPNLAIADGGVPGTDLYVGPGGCVGFFQSGNAADTVIACSLLYIEEDAP